MNNKELKNEKPENLQYKSKLNGEWKNMREKDGKDCFELFDRLGYEIRLNPNLNTLSVKNDG